jgi:hypothetical protein
VGSALEGQVIAIARDDTRAVGFMSLAPEGYTDFAFIRPEAQDQRPVPAAVHHDRRRTLGRGMTEKLSYP